MDRRRNYPPAKCATLRTCCVCGIQKGVSEFSLRCKSRGKLRSECKVCRRAQTARDGNKYHLKSKYGITEADRLLNYNKQQGCCFVCGYKPTGKRKLSIDHDHATGKVRGLLCSHCNTLLGHLEKYPEKVEALLAYRMQENFICHI